MAGFTFLGVPIDSVGRAGGTEHGPAKLRSLGLADLCVADAGDLDVRIRGDERDPGHGHPCEPRRTDDDRGHPQGHGGIPFVRRATVPGGGMLHRAARCPRPRRGTSWDARRSPTSTGISTCRTVSTSPTGEAADMPLSVVLGRGPAAWVDVCGGATARVEDVVPIGYRDPDEVPTFEQIAPELGPKFRPVSKDRRASGGTQGGRRAGRLRTSLPAPVGSGCTWTSTSWAKTSSRPPTT